MTSFATNENMMKSEIWQCYNMKAHFSFSFTAEIGYLFIRMLLDSVIALKFCNDKNQDEL